MYKLIIGCTVVGLGAGVAAGAYAGNNTEPEVTKEQLDIEDYRDVSLKAEGEYSLYEGRIAKIGYEVIDGVIASIDYDETYLDTYTLDYINGFKTADYEAEFNTSVNSYKRFFTVSDTSTTHSDYKYCYSNRDPKNLTASVTSNQFSNFYDACDEISIGDKMEFYGSSLKLEATISYEEHTMLNSRSELSILNKTERRQWSYDIDDVIFNLFTGKNVIDIISLRDNAKNGIVEHDDIRWNEYTYASYINILDMLHKSVKVGILEVANG